MEHLFASWVEVYRLVPSREDGMLAYTWTSTRKRVRCRLDIGFVRPGRDQPPPVEAGRAPDRIGVCFAVSGSPIRSGDRLVCVPGPDGHLPVAGTWEVRVVPDEAQAYRGTHHQEFQVIEVAQELSDFAP